jgi:endonuclease/exonuclease/phosphatase (EEP) superfamily protein YafD
MGNQQDPISEGVARRDALLPGIRLGSSETWKRWLLVGRRSLLFVSAAYLVLLVGGLLTTQWVGERNWFMDILLYLLPTYWLLPLVVLTPLSLLRCPKACWLHLLALMYVFGIFMQPRWSFPQKSDGPSFTLVTNNTGQRSQASLLALVRKVQPDFIALQDSSRELGEALSSGLGGRHVAQQREFVLISRFPILRSGLLDGLSFKNNPVAAWFEVDCGGKPLVIYNIHLPTPRSDLLALRGHGFLAGLVLGGGIYSSAVRQACRESLAQHVALAEELARRLAAEKRPFLAVGDFNAPSQGYVRRLFSSKWTDAFAATGQGYGLTFPGVTRNPLSCFGPWLRLDYIFVSDKIRPVDCWVEPREPAQHRAVVGRFRFQPRKTGAEAGHS